MRELQNGVILVFGAVFLILLSSSLIIGKQTYDDLPVDYLDAPIDECTHIERYEFDTPGIDAHEVETKVECKELLS